MSQTTDFKLKVQYIHKHLPQHPPPRGKTANLKQLPYRDILQRLAITCSFLLQLCALTLPPILHSSLLMLQQDRLLVYECTSHPICFSVCVFVSALSSFPHCPSLVRSKAVQAVAIQSGVIWRKIKLPSVLERCT